jgi:hypothetical protein
MNEIGYRFCVTWTKKDQQSFALDGTELCRLIFDLREAGARLDEISIILQGKWSKAR